MEELLEQAKELKVILVHRTLTACGAKGGANVVMTSGASPRTGSYPSPPVTLECCLAPIRTLHDLSSHRHYLGDCYGFDRLASLFRYSSRSLIPILGHAPSNRFSVLRFAFNRNQKPDSRVLLIGCEVLRINLHHRSFPHEKS